MFTIYHSNRLDVLKDLLLALIARNPPTPPLSDEVILVQSPGMAQWLRLQLADGLGLAAAVHFPLPASFLWQMYLQVLPDVPERSAFNKEAMTWKIMTLIPELLNRDSFSALKAYLDNDPDDLKCYQLAGKIADIFDQYLVYRPDWILKWQQGDNLTAVTGEHPWQPELWCALVEKTAERGQSPWHRANMHQQFNQQARTPAIENWPQRLFVFGISALPPHFLKSLETLGQHTDVHLMINNPCRYYWGDIKDPRYLARLASRRFIMENNRTTRRQDSFCKAADDSSSDSSNPLLASMGKLGRDYLYQVHEMAALDIDAFADIPRNDLLSHIQADIFELIDRTGHPEKHTIRADDRSLEIHSCHSPLREVEVLHDQLLALFEQNPQINPRDVVVMLPDVDSYSPWIQAVFGSLDRQDPRFIPFSISDRSACNEYPILSAILKLLDIDNSRCTAPQLLELLEIPALQRRFQLHQKGVETLRLWVTQVGIRWGIDSQQTGRFDLPPMSCNTWLFGLRRMMLGYAMPESAGLHGDILPFDAVQGMDAELAGQLADILDHIEQLSKDLDRERSVEQWTLYIHQLLERFFCADEEDLYPLKTIGEAMERLHEQLTDAGHEQPLSRAIVVSYLNEQITGQRNSQRFLAGRVNFCTLMPMRSIPFKVVCLLGMNDGAYPRSVTPTGFDLMAKHSQRGDRSRREDDRYLFLEALLSAQKRLYISYVGRSILDNDERAPSVLVTELLNYCQQGFVYDGLHRTSARSRLISTHPLQPFSPELFTADAQQDGDRALFSYAREWLPTATGAGQPPPDFMARPLKAVDSPEQLEMAGLIRFFKNPCRYFCQQRLKVFFDPPTAALADNEPFALDGLEQYLLKQELLAAQLAGARPEQAFSLQKARGLLPHGACGELLLNRQFQAIRRLAETLQPLMVPEGVCDDIPVQLNSHNLQLSGWLKGVYRQGLLRYRPSRIKGKDILSAWIKHLCYCACGHQGSTLLFGLDGKKDAIEQRRFPPLSQAQAQNHLEELIAIYQQGLNSPQPLFAETALAWLEAGNDGDRARQQARLQFVGSAFGGPANPEGRDPYIARIYPDFDACFDAMTALATRVMAPALDADQGAQP